MPRRFRWPLAVLCVGVALLGGCMSQPGAPSLGLQRSLYPGLGDLEPEDIDAALAIEVTLAPPVAAGLAWLSEAQKGSPEAATHTPVSEYGRTGVLDAALSALRDAPFATVAAIPTIPTLHEARPDADTLDRLRGAAARFQYDVALLLQTGSAEDRGRNPLALGYVGLVTAPLFPGEDLAVSSSAELCAIDVRTGVMLGCARGRGEASDRLLFLWQVERARARLVEDTLRESVGAAAEDLRAQVAARLAASGGGGDGAR